MRYLPLYLLLLLPWSLNAQTVMDLIREMPTYASCNYHIYPDTITAQQTPPPAGKRPFYISHYGRHGSRYINNRTGFDTPYLMMLQADSVNELTPIGERVLQEIRLIMADTEGRWGELTSYGREQHRMIARRMVQNFPEVFCKGATVKAVSTIVPRCMGSMGAAVMELLQAEPTMQVTMEVTQRNQWYMNHQDRQLRKN